MITKASATCPPRTSHPALRSEHPPMKILRTPRHDECGFVGKPSTPGRNALALRRHACDRHRQLRDRQLRRRQALARIDRSPKPCPHSRRRHRHATPACYRFDECRCWPCTRANSAVAARRRRLKGYRRWEPFAEADPVRRHLRELMAAGLGLARIAELSRVARSVLADLVHGRLGRDGMRRPVTRLRSGTADRILAVSADASALTGEAWVDAAGTRRRLQALACLGWPQVRLAERVGGSAERVRRLQLGGTRVRKATAEAIAAVYEQLWDTPAPEVTQRQRRTAEHARALARRHQWAPPMAWDDELNPIDDPAAEPDLGQRVRRSKLPPADELRFLLAHGESEDTIARRFGVKAGAVTRALQRARLEASTASQRAGAAGSAEGTAA